MPATAAACSRRATYSSSPSVWSCCGPSQIASSGSGCTSTMIPSAPAAAAAIDRAGTRLRRPGAWLGSTITGRWVISFSAGIAVMSSVKR